MISKASDLKVQGRHSREEGRGQQGRTPANTKQPRADQPDQTQARKESPPRAPDQTGQTPHRPAGKGEGRPQKAPRQDRETTRKLARPVGQAHPPQPQIPNE